MAFKFENLKVWQVSLDLADEIDKLSLTFPKHELYSLANQIKRSADSVSLNIVEGSTGLSNTEFKRFLRTANRSALEVVGCLFWQKEEIISRMKYFKFFMLKLKP
jgi:four helix bundle protein